MSLKLKKALKTFKNQTGRKNSATFFVTLNLQYSAIFFHIISKNSFQRPILFIITLHFYCHIFLIAIRDGFDLKTPKLLFLPLIYQLLDSHRTNSLYWAYFCSFLSFSYFATNFYSNVLENAFQMIILLLKKAL